MGWAEYMPIVHVGTVGDMIFIIFFFLCILLSTSDKKGFIYSFITIKLQVHSRLSWCSILNLFAQRSQYISIKFLLHKQSENPCVCYWTEMCFCSRINGMYIGLNQIVCYKFSTIVQRMLAVCTIACTSQYPCSNRKESTSVNAQFFSFTALQQWPQLPRKCPNRPTYILCP